MPRDIKTVAQERLPVELVTRWWGTDWAEKQLNYARQIVRTRKGLVGPYEVPFFVRLQFFARQMMPMAYLILLLAGLFAFYRWGQTLDSRSAKMLNAVSPIVNGVTATPTYEQNENQQLLIDAYGKMGVYSTSTPDYTIIYNGLTQYPAMYCGDIVCTLTPSPSPIP